MKKNNFLFSQKKILVSFFSLSIVLFLSLFAELWISNTALVVSYEGKLFFPIFSSQMHGIDFGLNYEYEVNYKELKKDWQKKKSKNWLIMPLVPWGAYELDNEEGAYPPHPPSFEKKHYLGTDSVGRDILARLVYGMRLTFGFSFLLFIFSTAIGIVVGTIMGYYSGYIDRFLMAIIEIGSNIPFLYLVMIISSFFEPGFLILVFLLVSFGWMGVAKYFRALTFQQKNLDYVVAAKILGYSDVKIIFKEILPNTISFIWTYAPFAIAGGITALTSLDYLGFGLMPPTPSWGELLKQGMSHLSAPWIVTSVVALLVFTLIMITILGEGLRTAFDPKKFIYFK